MFYLKVDLDDIMTVLTIFIMRYIVNNYIYGGDMRDKHVIGSSSK